MERVYTIVEQRLPSGTPIWEVVVNGYPLTGGMTLEIAISNLIAYAVDEEAGAERPAPQKVA